MPNQAVLPAPVVLEGVVARVGGEPVVLDGQPRIRVGEIEPVANAVDHNRELGDRSWQSRIGEETGKVHLGAALGLPVEARPGEDPIESGDASPTRADLRAKSNELIEVEVVRARFVVDDSAQLSSREAVGDIDQRASERRDRDAANPRDVLAAKRSRSVHERAGQFSVGGIGDRHLDSPRPLPVPPETERAHVARDCVDRQRRRHHLLFERFGASREAKDAALASLEHAVSQQGSPLRFREAEATEVGCGEEAVLARGLLNETVDVSHGASVPTPTDSHRRYPRRMAAGDRDRWNDKWAEAGRGTGHGSALVDLVEPWLPEDGTLLDVAGGGSHDSLLFARKGLDVTVADVSDVGLIQARQRALAEDLMISTFEIDLETEALPAGPWDVITVANYLQRDLFPALIERLSVGGVLAAIIATETNLERHERPGAPFLLSAGELPDLAAGLDVLHHSEEWRANGRHEAHLVARVPSVTGST